MTLQTFVSWSSYYLYYILFQISKICDHFSFIFVPRKFLSLDYLMARRIINKIFLLVKNYNRNGNRMNCSELVGKDVNIWKCWWPRELPAIGGELQRTDSGRSGSSAHGRLSRSLIKREEPPLWPGKQQWNQPSSPMIQDRVKSVMIKVLQCNALPDIWYELE